MPEEGFEVARAYVVVSADTGEAEAEVSDLESQMAELHGTVTIGADTAEATAAIEAAAEEADTTHADIHVGADTTEAQAKIAAIGEEANLAGATADLEALGSAADKAAADLSGTGTAAGALGHDVTAASSDIADFTDRLGLVAQEWHELDQVSNLPGMAEAGSHIQSLSKDLDELTARGGATAAELEAMEMRLDSVGDSLNSAEAHMGQFGDGIERVSGDLHNSAGMYKDFEAGLEGVARAADDAEAALSGGGGGGGGITGLITSLFESGGGLSGVAGIVGSLSAGIGAAAAFLAVMTEIGAVVTGVSAAIIGLGPAVLLAIPSIDEIKAAFKDTGAELDKLPASERDIVLGVRDIKTEYDKLAKSFAPDVFKIFDEGVKIASNLLKEAKPLADAAATGIEGILKQADKFTASKGFKDWLKQITPDIAPSLKAIGTLIGTIAVDWGKFMARFSPADIKNAFHILDNLVNWWATGFGRAISNAMNMWDDFSAAFKNVKNWVDTAVGYFKVGMGAIEVAVGAVVSNVEKDWDDLKHFTLAFQDDIISAAKTAWDDISRTVTSTVKTIVSGVEAGWNEVVSVTKAGWNAASQTVSAALNAIESFVTGAVHAVESAWDAGLSEVESITGTIIHAIESEFAQLPGQLFSLGEDAIMGLVHGIENMAGAVEGAISHIAGLVPAGLSHVLHMLSPSMVMRDLGHQTMEGYVLGLSDYEERIQSEMAHVGGTVAGGVNVSPWEAAPAGVRARGGDGVTVNMTFSGTSWPTPEQQQAMKLMLTSAVSNA